VVMGKIQQVRALRLADKGEGGEAGGGLRRANGVLSCGRRKAWAAGGGRMSSGHPRRLWRPVSGLRRGRLAFREASQAPRLWVRGRETRTHANRTIDIVSQADPTARGVTGDVDPLTARDIRQVSYCKDKDARLLACSLLFATQCVQPSSFWLKKRELVDFCSAGNGPPKNRKNSCTYISLFQWCVPSISLADLCA
jgi:hypothetical protein